MRRPAAWTHAQVHQRVHAAMSAAMRADDRSIERELGDARLDPYTREFVRDARRLVLGCTAALTCVLSAHRAGDDPYGDPVCRGCGTPECRTLHGVVDVLTAYAVRPVPIDRAEAWRRADARLGARPVSVEEFRDGFIVRPTEIVADDLSPVLIVDRHNGALSRWPAMPSQLLVREYARYREERGGS
ncbi:hypothetical protein [Actinomadura sp. CNU-125]|uniref:hypothetical protein n=1 Tax=Actinomadura sp. CNU-125 TaxID=1904961 RepID=UPI001177D32A|nr:hypothetical protein [Actinomadura sp. CNU-125]